MSKNLVVGKMFMTGSPSSPEGHERQGSLPSPDEQIPERQGLPSSPERQVRRG